MNPIDRAHAVLRHAEAYGLGQSLQRIGYLNTDAVHVEVHGGLAPLIAWARTMPVAVVNVSPHGGLLHVLALGRAGGLDLVVAIELKSGPEYEYLTEMAVTGLIEPGQLQRFVHQEVE